MGYNLSGPPVALGQDLYTSSTTAAHALGTPGQGPDGTQYRYCKVGSGAALVVGNVIQAAVGLTTHQNLVCAAAAIGDTTITVTLGNAAIAENYFAGGTAVVTITPGLGQTFRISGHPAASALATLALTLSDSVRVALTTDSRIDLTANVYSGVIQSPATTLTGPVVGVCTTIPIAASAYGWIQTKGPGGVLGTDTSAMGLSVGVPCGTGGAVVGDSAAIAGYTQVGKMMAAGASGEVNPCFLTIE